MAGKADGTPQDCWLRLLDEAYDRKSWHGTNLRGSLRGLTAAQAARRGRPGGPRIVDIVVHCAYWKYTVRRQIRGQKRGSFALPGSNWIKLPDPLTPEAWKSCVALLAAEHVALRAALAELDSAALREDDSRRVVTLAMRVRGVAMHDVYHAGQIQSIKAANRGPRA